MRVAVIGGTGLIGAKVATVLAAQGHDVVIASRATGVNSYTGEGLAEAVDGVETVIDVSNSGYYDERAAMEFFYGSTLNLLTHGAAAGVTHHVALSVVGTDRLAASEGGYFAAKAAQERLIHQSGRPFTIVHSTQFFEFVKSIAEAATVGHRVRLAQARIQPVAGDDIAGFLAGVATSRPRDAMVEFAGPDQFRLDELVRTQLRLRDDPREVVADPLARYFGSALAEDELMPAAGVTLGSTRFSDWLR